MFNHFYCFENTKHQLRISTSSYNGAWDLNVLGVCDMDSIGVRAIPRCCHCEIRNLNILRVLEWNLHLLAIFYRQILHCQIFALVESQCLQLRDTNNEGYIIWNGSSVKFNRWKRYTEIFIFISNIKWVRLIFFFSNYIYYL